MIKSVNKLSIELHIIPSLVSMAFFMPTMDVNIVNTALPTLANYFRESPFQIQSIVLAYIISMTICLPLGSWLFEKLGSRFVFLSGLVLFSLGTVLSSLSVTIEELLIYRVIQGIGGAFLLPAGRLEILKFYPEKMLVSLLSFIMVPGMAGLLIGPVIGGFIIEYLSWRWVFIANIPIAIICFVLSYFFFPEVVQKKSNRFDILGFIMFASFVLLVSLSIDETHLFSHTIFDRVTYIISAFLVLLVYILYAQRKTLPLFSLEIMKISSFRVAMLSNILSRIGGSAIPFLVPMTLQIGLGFTALKSGIMLLFMGATSIVGRGFTPILVKKLGYKLYLIYTSVIVSIVTLAFCWISNETAEYLIAGLLALFGFVSSLVYGCLTAMTLTQVPKQYVSEANSLLTITIQFSTSIGIGAAGLILGASSQYFGVIKGAEVMPIFDYAYIMCALLSLLTVVSAARLPKI